MNLPEPVPILLLVREADCGGTERQLTELAKAIDRSRFEPHVATFRPGGLFSRELQAAGVQVVDLGLPSFRPAILLGGVRRLAAYVRRHRIRIIHTFDEPANIFGVFAGRLLRGPAVVSSQRAFRELVSPMRRRLLRATDRLADAIVVNCVAVRDHMVREEGAPAARLRLCYNGLDTAQFHPGPRRRPEELGGAALVIGCVCRMRPEKDLSTLVDAFARVARGRPALRLLLVGGGPCQADLEARSRALGVAQQCLFRSAVQNVAEWLRAIDVFVLPSVSEALSNSLMEAMASGCCVVASRVGGNPELVEDGVSGLLFEPRNTAGLAAALETVADDAARRELLACRATGAMRESFSLAGSVSRMEKLYGEVLAARG
jgi:glycosyltransferase involved in cell wall biosynthesis